MKYQTNNFICDVVKYDGSNINEVLTKFPELSASGTTLKDSSGMNISTGVYLLRMPNNSIKCLSESTFSTFFTQYEEPTYPLSELAGATKLTRKAWNGIYIEYTGYCWIYNKDGSTNIWNPTPEDLSASDWQSVI